MTGASQANGLGSAKAPEPSGLGPTGAIPSAVGMRRTISAWETIPRDGTPFHILNTLRFNPLADRFEALCRDNDACSWQPCAFVNEPSMWLRQVPLPYEIPTSLAFTLTYEVTRKRTWRERFFDRLFGHLMFVNQWTLAASAMSACGQDNGDWLEAKPASAVPNGETPQ